MVRDLTAGMITEIDAKELRPLFLVKAEFTSGDVNFWTGHGEITYNSETYTGAGNLLDVSNLAETQELIANGVDVTLTGLPSSLVALALSEPYQGRPLTIWFGCLDGAGTLIADPYMIFKGLMDVMVIEDDAQTAKITVAAESSLIALRDSKERRYTDEDQKSEYPEDEGFAFVALSQDVTLSWGAGVQ